MCVFGNMMNDIQCTVSLHVDDIFVMWKDMNVIDAMVRQLTEKYIGVMVTKGNAQLYLGMTMDFKSYIE